MSDNFFHIKRSYLIFAVILLAVEILIALFVTDKIIRPYGGDLLAVILLYCLLKAFLNVEAWKIALGVLVFSFALEFAQYFNLIDWLGLGDNKFARIVIGTSYSSEDLIAYTLGLVCVLIFEYRSLLKQRFFHSSTR